MDSNLLFFNGVKRKQPTTGGTEPIRCHDCPNSIEARSTAKSLRMICCKVAPAPRTKQVKAWGVINAAGELMANAFDAESKADWDMLNRWPRGLGQSRVVPVTITVDEVE